ncbi:hypothetical protein [Altibacter sp. HG106]|uniref:hypothetical protein n=1 Tax=Altibacter sp. HG106 TaxID=3023937 RepID=UPI00234FBE2F|nr:hypothetical protein [Altibacter sp. HG106]MDC7994030.1 hypothetical protein [Altibacter sp. HG106]
MGSNINTGNVNTNGGAFRVGDTYNIHLQGLELLLQDYKAQLQGIKLLIDEFKPDTALKQLENLQKRIPDELNRNPKIKSKILFLSATCKRELQQFAIKETAKEFVQAYRLNPTDTELREKAGIEYLNLQEPKKADKIADEILKEDEFSIVAWLIRLHNSKDLKVAIEETPKSVQNEYVFKINIANYILRKHALGLNVGIDNFQFKVEYDKYNEVTFTNRQLWSITLDLLINEIFGDYPIRFLAGKENPVVSHHLVKNLMPLLKKYVATLQNTELSKAIWHHKHVYHYFDFFLKKEKSRLDDLKNLYASIPKENWFYTMTFVQALLVNSDYEDALLALKEYEKSEELVSELYLVKSAVLFFLKRTDEIEEVFDSYLDGIEMIDEQKGFNILNSFFNVFNRTLDKELFLEHIEKVKSKKFKSKNLKQVFIISCETRYLDISEVRKEKLSEELKELEKADDLDHNYKSLIAESYQSIDRINEAIDFLSEFVNKEKPSQELVMYASLLYKKLQSNEKTGEGNHSELLDLLKNFRTIHNQTDEELLRIEYSLHAFTNNWSEVKSIVKVLKEIDPTNEQYLVAYVKTLEILGAYDEIKNEVSLFPASFADESVALLIAVILLRNDIEADYGFKILYNLALNQSNTQARKEYLALLIKYDKRFFEKYEKVKIDVWVRFRTNGKDLNEIFIDSDSGFKGKLIGKKVGDTVTDTNNLDMSIHTVEIVEIYNDALKLLRNIQEEIENPLNELGFKMIEFPSNKEEFEDFLIKNFGARGTEEKEYKEKGLQDYYNSRIGFSEVSKMVFRGNMVDAYFYLTGHNTSKFTTLPILATNPINTKISEVYGLDVTSLILFYQLYRKLNFQFEHKFTVSYYTKQIFLIGLKEAENAPEDGLTTQITLEGVKVFPLPDKNSKIEFYREILKWIDENCLIDNVEEKLEIALRLEQEGKERDTLFGYLVDNMFLTSRNGFRLITSDSSLYLLKSEDSIQINKWLLSPEKYLRVYNRDKCDTEFYSFLLQNNYSGIDLNLDVLKNEFFQMLAGKDNQYSMALYNLQYSLHNNNLLIPVCAKFLKDIYLTTSITTENKNRYAFDIIRNLMYGMGINEVNLLGGVLFSEFKLMGANLNEVMSVHKEVKSLYFK